MSDLDLDISNYTINDIERFFKFEGNKNYTSSDVEVREYEIREQLLKSGHINKTLTRDLISFLTKAKEWLILTKSVKPSPPTTLPKITRLDQTDYHAETHFREENLIERNKTQFINTKNDEYFPGSMNPLSTRVITKCLTIDTRFRDNYFNTQSSDLMIQLPMKIPKVVSMQLSAIELPITFYGISASYGNNFLYIGATYTPVGGTSTYTDNFILIIPDGNYNAQDLIDTLNRLLRPVDKADGVTMIQPESPFSYIQLTLDITNTGSGTGKVYIQTTGEKADMIESFSLDFTRDINGNVDNVDISTKLGWNLGFRANLYTDYSYYMAETTIEPTTLRYVYLAIDDFNNSVNNHFLTAFNKSILNKNILARISLTGSYFTMIMENNLNMVTEPRKYFGPVDIQRLHIQLFDDRGRVVPMNSADFSFCLIFKQLYDL